MSDTYYCRPCDREYDRYDHSHDICEENRKKRASARKATMTSTTSVINPKDKQSETRVPLWLVPEVAIAHMADGFKHGLDANPDRTSFNWRETPVKISVYLSAAKRHIAAVCDGEDIDPASDVPHLALAMDSLAIILEAKEHDSLIDDRPKVNGGAGRVLARLRKQYEGPTVAAQSASKEAPVAEQSAVCQRCGLTEFLESTVAQRTGAGVFCADCWRFNQQEQAPVTEQWGVFYKSPNDSILRRSTEVAGEYLTEHDAMCAAADYCNKMGSCNWFAQKL